MAVVRGGLPWAAVRGGYWGCHWPRAALPAPNLPAAFQGVDMTVVRTLKRKAQEKQV